MINDDNLRERIKTLRIEAFGRFGLTENQQLTFSDSILPLKFILSHLGQTIVNRPDFYVLAFTRHFHDLAEGRKTIKAIQLGDLAHLMIHDNFNTVHEIMTGKHKHF